MLVTEKVRGASLSRDAVPVGLRCNTEEVIYLRYTNLAALEDLGFAILR